MRVCEYARLYFVLAVVLWAAPCRAAPPQHGAAPILTKEQLIGAWRLVRIDYSGPRGAALDPFYQPDSTGLIIYDASGWMSVHIAAPHRRSWQVPANRTAGSGAGAGHARAKVAAFDSFYAYYGTWDFDPATSVLTHHVKSALIPAESGLDYSQQAALEGDRLSFTTRSGPPGHEMVRTKIWERAGTPDGG
jgi:hypothetical protein